MHSHNLDQLAFRFFKLFAQFESTMKERGFFRLERNGRIAVDWNRFANEVAGPEVRQQLKVHKVDVDYILHNPPMRQSANSNKQIIWVEVFPGDESAQALFGHICRIRNNLFHGAKFNDTWFDPIRSKALLTKGLQVLEYYRAHWLNDNFQQVAALPLGGK